MCRNQVLLKQNCTFFVNCCFPRIRLFNQLFFIYIFANLPYFFTFYCSFVSHNKCIFPFIPLLCILLILMYFFTQLFSLTENKITICGNSAKNKINPALPCIASSYDVLVLNKIKVMHLEKNKMLIVSAISCPWYILLCALL